jgi:hypothetical protein
MSHADIEENIRKELLRTCCQSRCRTAEFSRNRPTKWRPTTVIDPRDDEKRYFSDNTAWEYIAELLSAGVHVEILLLDLPPGKKGYVMKIPQPDGQVLYIKLQLAAPGIVGRSFHYSD